MNYVETSNNTSAARPSSKMPIIVMGIILLPMVFAYIIFHTGIGIPTGTTNKGELLSPAISVNDLQSPSGELPLAFMADLSNKRWRILVPMAEPCGEVCQKNLYTTRQVHIRLAEKAYRVERVLVHFAPLSTQQKAFLDSEHPNAQRVLVESTAFGSWLAAGSVSDDQAHGRYFLVDQEGFAMMSYHSEHSGQDLLTDIKKLLKFTYDK